MSGKKEIHVQIDAIPNLFKIGRKEDVKEILQDGFDRDLDGIMKRYEELPPLIAIAGDYSDYLDEARRVYCYGNYVSCIALSGMTAEKIAKEYLVKHIEFIKNGKPIEKDEDLIEYIYRIEMNTVRELLVKSGIIEKKLRKPFQEIMRIRNKYVHGRGKNPEKDANKAIDYLHKIVDGTIFVLKDYALKDGFLVQKENEENN